MREFVAEVAEPHPAPRRPTPAEVGAVIRGLIKRLEPSAARDEFVPFLEARARIGSFDQVDWEFVAKALVTTCGRLQLEGISPDEACKQRSQHVDDGIELALGL